MNAADGTHRTGPFRLSGIRNVFASPVGANNRVYIVDRMGNTLVFEHSTNPKPIALNRLDDQFNASPAIAGNTLYLRGKKYLYAITESGN